MEEKLHADRWQRLVADPSLRAREKHLDILQKSYGYSRLDSEKVFEIVQTRTVEFLFGATCGGIAAWKATPIQRELS